MATQIVNPLSNILLQQQYDAQVVGVGVTIPFSSPSVFTSTYSTLDQIRYNLINFVLTNNDERFLVPNYGCDLRSKLFDHLTPTNIYNLETYLIERIQSNFPQVRIISLTITPIYEQNSINIQINYSVLNSETQTLQITL